MRLTYRKLHKGKVVMKKKFFLLHNRVTISPNMGVSRVIFSQAETLSCA